MFKKYLKVRVIAGRDLESKDSNGYSDPYAIVSIVNDGNAKSSQKQKTKTVKKSLNPIWGEEYFTFQIDDEKKDQVKVKVMDYDRLSHDDYLGEININIGHLQKAVKCVEWFKLRNVKKGEVQIELEAINFGDGMLQNSGMQPQQYPSGMQPQQYPSGMQPQQFQSNIPPQQYQQYPPQQFQSAVPPQQFQQYPPQQFQQYPPQQFQSAVPPQQFQPLGMPPQQFQQPMQQQQLSSGQKLDQSPQHKDTLQNAGSSGGWQINFNEIQFDKKIGAGGFGEVWKGEWAGTEVAIKKILKSDISEADLDEFTGEILLMSKMRHPNIVQFLGACLDPEFCLVTEFMAHGSLFHLLAKKLPELDWVRKIKIALDVAKGLLYLHSRDPIIVHRDIKSLNILVTEDWKAVVSDFGLTKIKTKAMLNTRCGSPAWSAPEVLRGEPYNEKADIFSYAVVLWEIITDEPPYKGINPMTLIGQVAYNKPSLRPPIPTTCPFQNLIQLMTACWDDDPSRRPNFEQIITSLKGILNEAKVYVEQNPSNDNNNSNNNSN